MRRATIPQAAEEARNDIDLTPMLDVVFIMLIFFLVVASFLRETGLDVSRSDTSAVPPTEKESILVSVEEDNGIWMDGRLIDPRAVRANVERLRAVNPAATIVIQAHKRSANNTLAHVMDAARQAGVYDISLSAEDG